MEWILFVCTGNLCRSPMAAALAEARLAPRPYEVAMESAGLIRPGVAPPQEMVATMKQRGLALGHHRSQALRDALELEPDLVVGMAREHVREVVGGNPGLYFPRSFTLKGLVRRATAYRRRLAAESLSEYLAALGEGRDFVDIVGMSTLDDVADPIGRGQEAFERCALELEALTADLVDHLWPAR